MRTKVSRALGASKKIPGQRPGIFLPEGGLIPPEDLKCWGSRKSTAFLGVAEQMAAKAALNWLGKK